MNDSPLAITWLGQSSTSLVMVCERLTIYNLSKLISSVIENPKDELVARLSIG